MNDRASSLRSLEALLFISDEPVTSAVLAQALGADRAEVDGVVRGARPRLRGAGVRHHAPERGRRVATDDPPRGGPGRGAVRPGLASRPADEGGARDALDRRVQAAGHPAPDLGHPRGELGGRPAGARGSRTRGRGGPGGDAGPAGPVRDDPGVPRTASVCRRCRPFLALAPLLRAGPRTWRPRRPTPTDGDARRAAPAFARPRRVRVASRVRGGDRGRPRRDQRTGGDAGGPGRSRRATRCGSTARRSTSTPSSERSPCTSRGT